MKKAALLAAALAMVLSLAACGNRDDSTPDDPAAGGGTMDNNDPGVNNNGITNGSRPGDGITDSSGLGGSNGGTAGSAAPGGSVTGGVPDSSLDNSAGTGSNGSLTGSGNDTGTGADNAGTPAGRSRVGDDLRRAADNVGDAVTGMVDEGRSADAAHVEATGEDAGRDAPMAADGAGLRREGRCGAGEDGLHEAGMACTAPVGRCGRTVSVRAAGGRRAMAPRGASAPVRCPCGPLSGRRCAGASGAPLGRPSVGAIVAQRVMAGASRIGCRAGPALEPSRGKREAALGASRLVVVAAVVGSGHTFLRRCGV